MKRKVVVGLTGNIATGKSTVMALARERGADTIDADKVAHGILRNGQVKAAIRAGFGDAVFDEAGEVVRPALGKIVFAEPEKMRELEAITHPAVREEIGRKITTSTAPVVIVEAIKLLEGPLKDHCDAIWVTACSAETQIARLMKYRNSAEDDARMRVTAQSPQEDKIAQADSVINTDGSLEETESQFITAWNKLTNTNSDCAT